MTNYIPRHEWLQKIDPAWQPWWDEFAGGLLRLKRRGLEIKFTDKGFLRVRFRDVGLSNSQCWGSRNHVALGYEQASTTTFQDRRLRFIPIIEKWIGEQTWGKPTNETDSRYCQAPIPDHPSRTLILEQFARLLDNLEV